MKTIRNTLLAGIHISPKGIHMWATRYNLEHRKPLASSYACAHAVH